MPYRVPDSVTARLRREFDDRLRIRYSRKTHTFHVEGKVSRAISDMPIPNGLTKAKEDKLKENFYDDLIRARDGYQILMEVAVGHEFPCPRCGMPLKSPVMKSAEVTCLYCRNLSARLGQSKRNGLVPMSYWPLDSEAFFERLRYLDPLRSWRRTMKQLDAENDRREEVRVKDEMNILESFNRDHYTQIAEIPQSALTHGKVRMWKDAPESPLVKAVTR